MSKNNRIKNLVFDRMTLYRLTCYGTVTLVSIGLMGVIGDKLFPGETEYPEYVIVQDPWENQSEDENSYHYVRNSRYYDLDEESYVILDSLKNDVDKLEVLLGNPDTITTEVYLDKLSDSEINMEKRLVYPEESFKANVVNNAWKVLIFLSLLGVGYAGGSAFLEEVEKRKTFKKF